MAATLTAMNPMLVAGGVMATINLNTKGIATNCPWDAGQFLRIDSSGRLIAIVTNAAAYATSGGLQYYSLSRSPMIASGTDTVAQEVGILTGEQEWEGNAVSSTLAITDIGTQCMLNVSALSTTGSLVTVDKTTTYPHIVITNVGYNFDPAQYASDDIDAEVRFKVLVAAIQAPRAA